MPDPSQSPSRSRGENPAGLVWLWVEAARARTLPAAVAPVAMGVALAAADGVAHAPAALAALIGAMAIQIGTNFANDYFDFQKGTDHAPKLGRRRLLPSGLIAPRTMALAATLAFGVAVLVGLYLVWRGGVPILIVGIASILAGVLYTGGPMPYGYRGLGDVFVLAFFGPVAVAGTYFVQAQTMDWVPVVAGLGPGLIAVAILAVNNLRDAPNDVLTGKRTLAVILGERFARHEHAATIVAGVVAVPAGLVLAGAAGPWALLPLLAMVPALGVIRCVQVETDSDRLNLALARTGQVLVIYAALFCIGWLI